MKLNFFFYSTKKIQYVYLYKKKSYIIPFNPYHKYQKGIPQKREDKIWVRTEKDKIFGRIIY